MAPTATGACSVANTNCPLLAAHGRLGRHGVAHFADHDHVGALPQHSSEQLPVVGTVQLVDLRLQQPVDGILDRIFDRMNLSPAVVQVLQAGVERGGLAGAGRSGDQDQPAGALQPAHQHAQLWMGQTERFQREQFAVSNQDSHGHALAVQRGHGIEPQVDRRTALAMPHPAAALRFAPLVVFQPGRGANVKHAAGALLARHTGDFFHDAELAHGDSHLALAAGQKQVAGADSHGVVDQQGHRQFGREPFELRAFQRFRRIDLFEVNRHAAPRRPRAAPLLRSPPGSTPAPSA